MLAPMTRRWLVLMLAAFFLACGGTQTRLKTVSTGKGDSVELSIFNASGTSINNLYVTESAKVSEAKGRKLAPGSPAEMALWGEDILRAAIQEGEEFEVPQMSAGRYDVLVVDKNGREQHVTGVKLKGGGTYRLELGTSGWQFRE